MCVYKQVIYLFLYDQSPQQVTPRQSDYVIPHPNTENSPGHIYVQLQNTQDADVSCH